MTDETYCQKNLSWVVPEKLCGSSCPGNGSIFELEVDLNYLASIGISGIISLNESGLDSNQIQKKSMQHLILPVADHYGYSSHFFISIIINYLRV
jgi:hypothetical protein